MKFPLSKFQRRRKTEHGYNGKDGQGRPIHPRMTEVKEQVVVLASDQPLSDKTLYFDVKILDIEAASAP